jgi:hypothetical protein
VRKALALSLILTLIPFSSSGASTVKMQSLKATTVIPLSADANDQVSTLIVSPTSIVVAGTRSGDGFLTAFDKTGSRIEWSLHLGGASTSNNY